MSDIIRPPHEGTFIDDKVLEGYTGELIPSRKPTKNRILVGVPMTGLLRAELVLARYGQTIPCNWATVDFIQWLDQTSPMRFQVADARNIVCSRMVEEGFEWLFFIDHDTILPPHTLLTINDRILKEEVPMWSGLYFTKSVPSEPILYRGRGTGYYNKWKLGDLVWVDGIPMGCTLIHYSILKILYDMSEDYEVSPGRGTKRIFETPSKSFVDPKTLTWFAATGTEDLEFCQRIMENDVLKKAGWKKVARRKYPFMVDTNIFCRHIDWNGVQYPSAGEEKQFER